MVTGKTFDARYPIPDTGLKMQDVSLSGAIHATAIHQASGIGHPASRGLQ
jgi:hypothetical protein